MDNKNKFRAWDVDEKRWIPPDQIAITGDGRIITKTSGEDDAEKTWAEETIPIVIVEFAGYYDRDGQALFKEDIIELNNPGDSTTENDTTSVFKMADLNQGQLRKMRFYNGALPLSGHEPITGDRLTQFIKIGNRLENPELWEEEEARRREEAELNGQGD